MHSHQGQPWVFLYCALGMLLASAGAAATPPELDGWAAEDSVRTAFAELSDRPVGMVWVPAGEVRMGQAGLAQPVHDLYLDGFYIDTEEVSNAEFAEFIEAGGYENESWWNPVGWAWKTAFGYTAPLCWNLPDFHGGGIPGNELFPVNGVSWWEADAYCRWAGKRLPTEAEWEKAAKGGCETHGDPELCDGPDTPTYPWGEGISGRRANYSGSGDPWEGSGGTTPTGYYDGSRHRRYRTQDSPGPYGLYDVAGNLWEWCSSRYADYPYDPNDGREEPPHHVLDCCQVIRGGAWNISTPTALRCSLRYFDGATGQGPDYGFRCAQSGPAPVLVPVPGVDLEAFPNPSGANSTIRFTVPEGQWLDVEIYTAAGGRLRRLRSGDHVAGQHTVVWDGLDATGRRAPAGVYFARLRVASGITTARLILIR